MKIYTSYFANRKKLESQNIEVVAISRGKPRGWRGRSYDQLAPTWQMLKMSDDDYEREYQKILASNSQEDFITFLSKGLEKGCVGVALCCWEKDINDCHRKEVGEWLRSAGYEVEEFGIEVDKPVQERLL